MVGVGPLFKYYVDVVVIVWKGCTYFGESLSIIFNLDKELRWYMVESGYFKGFMLVY